MTIIVFDILMALLMFFIGGCFYMSQGRATRFLTGYNENPVENERNWTQINYVVHMGYE